MKTLKEQVTEIMSGKDSKQTKAISLVKLGITPYEIRLMLGCVSTAKGFNVNTLTFGVEIECYNVRRNDLLQEAERRNIAIYSQNYNHRDNKEYYKIVSDGSISGEYGQEVVSPILKGKKGESSLKKVCESLNSVGAKVNRSTGLHVHFGAEKMSDEHFVNIFKNYQALEATIDSFMPSSRRGRANEYCQTLANLDYSGCCTKDDVARINISRYRKVNAHAYMSHKTIEFRQHSGTTDYNKILNWINFLRKLIVFSFDKNIDRCDAIEEIPFLTQEEKSYFISRREALIQ